MKNFVFFFTLVLIITISSCKKSEELSPIDLLHFAKEGLDYVQLPLNRYFIYKDSASGNVDSVIVTKSSLATIHHQNTGAYGDWTYDYQTLSLELTKVEMLQRISWYKLYAEPSITIRYIDTEKPLITPEFWYPYDPDNYKASLSIEGNSYTDVLEFNFQVGTDPTQSDYYKGAYYWVKHIGIIKRIVKTNLGVNTSTLLRYGN